MAKQYHHLYPQIVTFANLWQAWKDAARGKRGNPAVAAFEYDLERNLLHQWVADGWLEVANTSGRARRYRLRFRLDEDS